MQFLIYGLFTKVFIRNDLLIHVKNFFYLLNIKDLIIRTLQSTGYQRSLLGVWGGGKKSQFSLKVLQKFPGTGNFYCIKLYH